MSSLVADRSQRLWIVTGAAGYLGNVVVRELVARGERVRALVHSSMHPASLAGVDCERMRADVLDVGALTEAFRSDVAETVVVHAASVVSIEATLSPQAELTNTEGVRNVVAATEANKVTRLIHVSSVHATPETTDGSPIRETNEYDPERVNGAYAKSKAAGSRIVAESHLDWVVVQPSGLIGPGDFGSSSLTQLVRRAASGRLPSVTPGGYDFVDVRDVAESIIAAAFHGRSHESYLLTGNHAEAAELVRAAVERAGRKMPPMVPMSVALGAAPLMETWARIRHNAPIYTRYSLSTLRSQSTFDHSKASRELDHTPRPLRESITDTVDWLGMRAK